MGNQQEASQNHTFQYTAQFIVTTNYIADALVIATMLITDPV